MLYLTFDDGPDARWTPAVLDLLDKYGAKATFFETGWRAANEPGLVAAVRARGHALGNHSMNHPDLTKGSADYVRSQIADADAKLGPTTCFRPPFGAVNPSVSALITAAGKRSVMWDIDPQDWSRPGTDAIVQRVVSQARSGAIVLMHDGGNDRSQTVAATEIILKTLKAKGFQFQSLPGC